LQTREERSTSLGASTSLLEVVSIKQGQSPKVSLRIAVLGADGRQHIFYVASVPLNLVGAED